jgi:tRNA A-37 threonylcarbamoyl transferase component Bud32/DNA-directed RNA polymerase subunit RPC12/RpoP
MAETDDRALARRAIETGCVTQDQVFEALLVMAEERKAREGQMKARSIGAVLVGLGYIRQPDLDRIVAELRESKRSSGGSVAPGEKTLYSCSSCGARFNILKARPGGLYSCKKCGGNLEIAPPPDPMGATMTIPATRRKTAREREEEAQVDRAVAVYARQKNMVRRDAIRDAEVLQQELADYGIEATMVDVLKRRRLISWQQAEQLKKVDFIKVVRSEMWRKQSVPGYQIGQKLASGGFATIYTAEPVFGGERVALKLLREQHMEDVQSVERFRHEGLLMMRLSHPNIVKAFDQGVHKGLHYITMEYVQGEPLDEVVRSLGPVKGAFAVQVGRQVAEALYYMQQEGYIHRDLKPENILLNEEWQAKVCDLGFAMQIRAREGGFAQTTLGTAGYVSPEQARGELDLKVGTDIYSLGLTFYYMLAGQQAFQGDTTSTIMAERFSGGVATPDYDRMRAGGPLLETVKKMLHPDRAQRFTTYPELIKALEELKA